MRASATRARSAGPIRTPTLTRLAGGGLEYNRFHYDGALLADASGAAVRAKPSLGGVRNGRRVRRGRSRLHRDAAEGLPAVSEDPAGQRLLDGVFGKWHLTPDNQQGVGGPFDRWPNALGFDYFWGFLGGESGQFDPMLIENNRAIGVPAEQDFYLPDAMAEKTIEWLHGVRAHDVTSRGSPTSRPAVAHAPHQVPKPSGRTSTRASSTRAGTSSARRPSRVRRSSASIPADAELTPRDPRRCPPGTRCRRDAAARCTHARWRSTPASARTPTGTSAASSTRSRRWASSTTRS